MSVLGKLRKSLFGASHKEATAFRKGDSAPWKHLEKVSVTVIEGYNLVLEDSTFEVLAPRLNAIEDEFRGFAYEGAGMGLAAMDFALPWKQRLQAFVHGPGAAHIYPVYIGAGLAMARLHMRPERLLPRLDPVVGWMALDGYGFHEGFFSRRRYVEEKTIPVHLSHYARRVFDQGLGRGLWFLNGADVDRIAATVAAFQPSRQADLWSGVGLACTYAGGVERAAIETLQVAAGPYRTRLAHGATIAALGRQEGGIPATHTNLACEILCGLSSERAASIADIAKQNLPLNGAEPAYDIWRQRIEAWFMTQETPPDVQRRRYRVIGEMSMEGKR